MYEKYYYVDNAGQRQGPLEPEQLKGIITADTLVWTTGMTDWKPAGQVANLAFLFSSMQFGPDAPEPPSPTPGPQQQAQEQRPQWQRPQESWHTPGYGTPQPQMERADKPYSYLVWSILTTIFVCMPLGIAAIVYSARTMSLNDQYRYDEAAEASRMAKRLNWISLIFVLAGLALYMFIIVGVALAASSF